MGGSATGVNWGSGEGGAGLTRVCTGEKHCRYQGQRPSPACGSRVMMQQHSRAGGHLPKACHCCPLSPWCISSKCCAPDLQFNTPMQGRQWVVQRVVLLPYQGLCSWSPP